MKKLFALLVIAVFFAVVAVSVVSARFPVRYLDIIYENAGDLEPSLILAVIMAESSFRPYAESRVGAQGLMQLMPPTAMEMARLMGLEDFEQEDVWLPEVNIALGSFYLNRLFNFFGRDVSVALAAYNAGQGNVATWLNNPDLSGDGVTLDSIPFPETYNYLRRVKRIQRIYEVILMLTRRD